MHHTLHTTHYPRMDHLTGAEFLAAIRYSYSCTKKGENKIACSKLLMKSNFDRRMHHAGQASNWSSRPSAIREAPVAWPYQALQLVALVSLPSTPGRYA